MQIQVRNKWLQRNKQAVDEPKKTAKDIDKSQDETEVENFLEKLESMPGT